MDLSKPVKIDIKKLESIWSPFKQTVWVKIEIRKPITREEVLVCLEDGEYIDPFQPKDMYLDYWDESTREVHLKRIAWLVSNYKGDDFPIEIDFGIPNTDTRLEINDGNHRLAAAIFLNKEYIMALVSGAESEINKYIFNK